MKIALILGTTKHSFHVTVGSGASAAGKDFGAEVDVQGAPVFSPADQEVVLNAVIEKKPDALIFITTSPAAMDEGLRAAAKAGIFVVLADSDVDNRELRHWIISSNHTEGGKMAGKLVASVLKDQGDVAVGTIASQPGAVAELLRLDGFAEGLSADAPDVRQLETEFCGMEPSVCASKVDALLEREQKLKAVFAPGEPTGMGAGIAISNAGRSDDILVGTFDASPSQVSDLKAGNIRVLVVQRPFQIGYESVRLVVEKLSGAAVSESPLLPPDTPLNNIPSEISVPFTIATHDAALCPAGDDLDCGQYDNPDVSQWFYKE